MKNLETFYKEHYWTGDLPLWDELSSGHKKMLKNSFAFWAYKRDIHLKQIKENIMKFLSNFYFDFQLFNMSIFLFDRVGFDFFTFGDDTKDRSLISFYHDMSIRRNVFHLFFFRFYFDF